MGVMWNRLASDWQESKTWQMRCWNVNHAPKLRLGLLWLGMILPLVVVATRMIQLQVSLRDDFATGFNQSFEVREDIEAHDGRILAADGTVLASDAEHYELQVHYRLLQEPIDSKWLRREAFKRLSRLERRDGQLIEAEERRVKQAREDLWSGLSLLVHSDVSHMAMTRKAIQKRVERTKASVLQSREQQYLNAEEFQSSSSIESQNGWGQVWRRLQRALSSPLGRTRHSEPIEEEERHHTIVANVDADARAELEAHPDRYGGVRIATRRRRSYPEGDLAAHLIGSRTLLTAEDVVGRQNFYQIGDRIGRSALELQYDSHLHGVRGERRLVKNRRGEVVTSEIVRAPKHGRDLVLTFDAGLQRRAEQLLDVALETVTISGTEDDQTHQGEASKATCPQGGCLVAMDVHSGKIVAAAAAPRFDLNLMVVPDPQRWSDLQTDPRDPLFRRVTQMAIAPGSVFKMISAVAAIESGSIDPHAPIYCQGYLDHPDQHRCLTYRHHKVGHGEMSLADALCRSCNVYFFTAARRMGPQRLSDWASRFGFGQPTGIDLPSEGVGHLPSPDEVHSGEHRRWHTGDTLGLAIGQSALLVTPLQVVRAMAAIANDGNLVTPHLMGDFGPSQFNDASSSPPSYAHPEPRPIADLRMETLAEVREGLTRVVDDPYGTAFKTVWMKEVTIAGKTGTAETGRGADHAWFAGYVPADRPRIAFVIVLEHGGSGGKAAGPVARQFVSALLELGLISPTANLVKD